MILKNPIEKYNKDTDIVMNNYGVTKNSETTSYIEEIGLKASLLEKMQESEIDNFPFSMPIIFNSNKEFIIKFFDKLIINLEKLIKEKTNTFPIEKTCWIQTMLESFGYYSDLELADLVAQEVRSKYLLRYTKTCRFGRR